MDHETHRAHTVAGLHQLADFLYEHDYAAELNTVSAVEVTYCVLNADADAARGEFEHRAAFLSDYAETAAGSFLQTSNDHEDTVQHSASVTFGNDTVQYRVLWIEREDKPDA